MTKKSRAGAKGIRKVKTGCLTCKIRHKKCNEARPACLQCVSTGRKCDFLPGPEDDGFLQSQLRSNPLNPVPVPLTRSLSYPSLGEAESSHFQYFHLVCTKEFSISFEIGLWGRIILRAACTEPCIMHAVVAIAALSRGRVFPESPHPSDFVSNFSLYHYNRALQELNKRLDTSTQSWELALLGSMVFIAFEVLQGNYDRVRMHMRSAFAILRSPPMAEFGTDITQVLNAFSRLDVQASSFETLHDVMPSHFPSVPPSFRSIDEARECLNAITGSMHSIFRKGSSECRRLPYSPLSLPLANDLSIIRTLLSSWHHLFSSLIANNPAVDIKTMAGIHILYIHHLVAEIRLSTNFYRNESAYDLYLHQFSQIVSLATSVMEADQAQPTSTGTGLCTILDIGMVQPLYFVARKCRDAVLRRKAIEVMKKVRRERVHDAQLLAEVLRWVVALEEEALEESDAVVLEEKRLHEVELKFDDVARNCEITAWRGRDDGSFEKLSALICTN